MTSTVGKGASPRDPMPFIPPLRLIPPSLLPLIEANYSLNCAEPTWTRELEDLFQLLPLDEWKLLVAADQADHLQLVGALDDAEKLKIWERVRIRRANAVCEPPNSSSDGRRLTPRVNSTVGSPSGLPELRAQAWNWDGRRSHLQARLVRPIVCEHPRGASARGVSSRCALAVVASSRRD